jgi:hypothetical protein
MSNLQYCRLDISNNPDSATTQQEFLAIFRDVYCSLNLNLSDRAGSQLDRLLLRWVFPLYLSIRWFYYIHPMES